MRQLVFCRKWNVLQGFQKWNSTFCPSTFEIVIWQWKERWIFCESRRFSISFELTQVSWRFALRLLKFSLWFLLNPGSADKCLVVPTSRYPSKLKQIQTSKQVQGLEMHPRLLSPMALLSTVLSKFWAQNWLKICLQALLSTKQVPAALLSAKQFLTQNWQNWLETCLAGLA